MTLLVFNFVLEPKLPPIAVVSCGASHGQKSAQRSPAPAIRAAHIRPRARTAHPSMIENARAVSVFILASLVRLPKGTDRFGSLTKTQAHSCCAVRDDENYRAASSIYPRAFPEVPCKFSHSR